MNHAQTQSWSYLDQPEFRSSFALSDDKSSYLFFLEGISCANCVAKVERSARDLGEQAVVNFAESTLKVTLSSKGSLAALAEKLTALGYRPHLIHPAQTQEQLTQQNRSDLSRLAVAGFVTGNIMLLAISRYAGLKGELAQIFAWVELMLFLPIVGYVALPFYRTAYESIRKKEISIDAPIVLAMLLGFLLSSYNLLLGSEHYYFDSIAGFIFLISASRYWIKRLQQKALGSLRFSELIPTIGVHRFEADKLVYQPLEEIKVGDVISLSAGEQLPFDGKLTSPRAKIDESVINGESIARVYTQGMQIFAGTKTQTPLQMQVTHLFERSKLGKLLALAKQQQSLSTHFSGKIARASQYLVAGVLLLAVSFFIWFSRFDALEAFHRAFALTVLACPCALALGAPLAFAKALQKAARLRIFIKDAETLEKLRQIKTIVFDKTGTLTCGGLSLSNQDLSAEYRSIILSLEAESQHPIAFALRQAWSDPLLPVEQLSEVPGWGLRGKIHGESYEFRKGEGAGEVELFKNNQLLCSLGFIDRIKPESKALIDSLKNSYRIILATGDSPARAKEVAKQLGIKNELVFAGVMPEEKAKIVEKYPEVLLVGDGANDILGMAKAKVSLSIGSSSSASRETAEVFIPSPNVALVKQLLILAKETNKVIHRNLQFALIYNLVAGSAALLGWVGPLGAAILMPISSAIIIALSSWGTSEMRAL